MTVGFKIVIDSGIQVFEDGQRYATNQKWKRFCATRLVCGELYILVVNGEVAFNPRVRELVEWLVENADGGFELQVGEMIRYSIDQQRAEHPFQIYFELECDAVMFYMRFA